MLGREEVWEQGSGLIKEKPKGTDAGIDQDHQHNYPKTLPSSHYTTRPLITQIFGMAQSDGSFIAFHHQQQADTSGELPHAT